MRRRVTVFGGSGFVGRHLVRRLARAGDEIRIAVRDPEAALYLKTAGDVGQIAPFQTDIRDPAQIANAVADADTVINLVGILYPGGGQNFEKIHVDGAAAIAAAAKAAGTKRLLHMSALGADADSPSEYGRSKAAGEAAVLEAFPQATVFRPSVIFGPEDGFFNKFAGLMRFLPVLPVIGAPMIPKFNFGGEGLVEIDFYGDGGPKFQPVYVGDVAEAMMRALDDTDSQGRTYELGGPSVYSFKQLMELLLAVTERKRRLVPLPMVFAEMESWFLQFLPKPLITPDQVKLMERDNVVSGGAPGLGELGVAATAAEAILPTYLRRFRAPRQQGDTATAR